MKLFARWVVFHPKTIITATLAVTIAATLAIASWGLSFNGSLETLAQSDGTLRFYNDTKRLFGDDRVIIVALTTRDVFTASFIDRLDRLTSRLASLQGVAEAQSLTNIKTARRNEGGVVIDRLIRRGASDDQLSALKPVVTADRLYARNYVSTDGRTAAVNVFISPRDEANTRALALEIERIARSEADADELLLAGAPIMDARGIRSMARDMLVCSPVAALLCLAVFLIAFRSFWGGFLPLASLLIGLIWVIGLMSLLGRPITIATVSLPTVLIAVGGSYMFHQLNQYRLSMVNLGGNCASNTSIDGSTTQPHREFPQLDAENEVARRAAWFDGLEFILPAIAVSGLTTMAGFGALASSSIPTVRDMGLFNAAGVFVMLLLTLTFIPATLALLPSYALSQPRSAQSDYAISLNKVLHHITALVLFRRQAVWLAVSGLTLVASAGVLRLRVNTDYLRIFPRSSDTVQSAEKLHQRLAGPAIVEVVLTGPPGAVLEPDFLGRLAALEEFALSQKGVDAAISVADILKRLGGLLSADRAAGEAIPDSQVQIEAIFRNFLSQEESLAHLVNFDGGSSASSAVVVLRTNLFSSNELKGLTSKISEWAQSNLPWGVTARTTGSAVLLNDASDAVAESQASSLAIALLAIYLMMVVLFRSFSASVLALIPNLLPIIGYFGFLGWTGITLDITTSLIASAALGLAVDNAVHMIRRYRQCAAFARNEGWAIWLTMLRSGKPMILANLMLIAAFLIFVLSSFVPVRVGGLLWAVIIVACLGADLVFLPVMMKSRPFAGAALGGKPKTADPSQDAFLDSMSNRRL